MSAAPNSSNDKGGVGMSATVIRNLKALSLAPMAEALRHQLEQPSAYEELSFTERLDLLVNHEMDCRRTRRQKRLTSRAGFRLPATLGEIDCRAGRNLNRSRIAELGQCGWIERAQNLLVTGPCGSGKTFVACALGHSACLLGHPVRYFRLPALLALFEQARATGEYLRALKRIGALRLVIIDDFGLRALDDSERHDLVELMDARYGRTSTAIASQLPVEKWHAAIGDATLADAILDRLVHNAHRIELRGESMRKSSAGTIAQPAADDESRAESRAARP